MTTQLRLTVALLALFAAACQPGGEKAPTAEAPPAATPATAPATAAGANPAATGPYAKFATGEFAKLETAGGLELPTSTFIDAAGKQHTFGEFKGKVVVFNIWGEWCGPCVEEMPTLAKLQDAFKGKDVVVVPIAFGPDNAVATAQAKLKSLAGDSLPFFYDAKYNTSADAKSGSFPSTIIYGKDGKEVARLEFPADWSTDAAKSLVQAVLDAA